jgi:hypothetical protein
MRTALFAFPGHSIGAVILALMELEGYTLA